MSNVYRLPCVPPSAAVERWAKQRTPVLWWRRYPRCAFCGDHVWLHRFALVEIAGSPAALDREGLRRQMLTGSCPNCKAIHAMEAFTETPWWRRLVGRRVRWWARLEYSR
jgi:hypothetical protein